MPRTRTRAAQLVAIAPDFLSAEITGNGGAQNTPHGLGAVPFAVMIWPTELPAGLAGGYDVTQGAHTTTNVVATVTNACKYQIAAWRTRGKGAE